MKVLLVSNVYPTEDGRGTPSIRIQKELLETLGVDIDVYPIETGNKRAYLKAALHFLALNFRKPQYDLIHAYYGLSSFAAVLQTKTPVVATFLGSDILAEGKHNDRDRRFSMFGVKKSKAVIVMSEEMKRSAGREDAKVIPFGVHLADFQPQDRMAVREKLHLLPDRKYILFPWNPARLVKRYDLVEAAVKRLQEKFCETELVVIYDQQHQVIVDYMNACDVIVVASDHEGSPVAIREALACNLPVVSVDVGDVGEMIEGVDQCLLVGQNPEALAEGLEKILTIGTRSNGRKKMQAYDMMKATEQVYEIYQQVLNSD